MSFCRRLFGPLVIGAAFGLLCLSAAQAEAPQLKGKGQAQGLYRLMVGDFEVTALNDGIGKLRADGSGYDRVPANYSTEGK
jgi:hypothetical protein